MTHDDDYLPADRGLGGLGLIMELAGSLFAVMTGMFGFIQVIAMSEMSSRGGDAHGMTGWLFILAGAGVVRSLFHRHAGSELNYGFRPAAEIRS